MDKENVVYLVNFENYIKERWENWVSLGYPGN
jgi:hypothetical protein